MSLHRLQSRFAGSTRFASTGIEGVVRLGSPFGAIPLLRKDRPTHRFPSDLSADGSVNRLFDLAAEGLLMGIVLSRIRCAMGRSRRS